MNVVWPWLYLPYRLLPTGLAIPVPGLDPGEGGGGGF